jgi:hypothetical protein
LGRLVAHGAAQWECGTLAIRPERIRVCGQRPPTNGVRATVREMIYRGDHGSARFAAAWEDRRAAQR